ncbi:uncharacterized protein [Aristolochia californica]|uniref:uncharacterized protein n=1 Tax=Aristolochia californica TaxID=171875 RepID=UPI0035E1C62C
MDYSLAALKLLCLQLKSARERPSSSPPSLTLGSIVFQRVWLQGVLVSASEQNRFLLDDGSDVIELFLPNDFKHKEWKVGMYVMVVGACVIRPADPPVIKVHKIVDLSPFADREAMWYLEVIEAHKMFYETS